MKEAVFPFSRFPGVDTILGPEMKSTGEVMGVGDTFGEAFVKSQLAAGMRLPKGGRAFVSVRDGDKLAAVQVARDLVELGFSVLATRGTAGGARAAHGIAVDPGEQGGRGPAAHRRHDQERRGELHRQHGRGRRAPRAPTRARSASPRSRGRVTYYTTIAGAKAACAGMKHLAQLEPYRLQDLHAKLRPAEAEAAIP